VAANQLWLSRQSNDLVIEVLGQTGQGVRVNNWYLGNQYHVEAITAGGQTLSDTRVDALVQAMAGVSKPGAGLGSLPAMDQAKVQTALATAWQG
jgi:hypothetical protein